jgi:2'-5' RNA ligase
MRLFIGISIGDEAREALWTATARMRKISDGRYAERDMYHITLAFLGELEEGRVDKIKSAMDDVAACARRVSLALSGAGTFGRGESAILYAGVKGEDGLRPIADELRRALAARGLPFDPKPFKAHITLARRVNATEELLGVPIEPIAFPVDALTLFHSCRVNGALRYLPIYAARFGEGDR